MHTIGVVIPTLNSAAELQQLLPLILASPLKPKVLVIDSASDDDTVAVAKKFGVMTHIIERKAFNHGTTREKGRRLVATDIVVMLTPDVVPEDASLVEKLVQPIQTAKAHLSYARQLPRKGADLFEAFPRSFNYPAKGHIRSLQDVSEHGIYSIFVSDSCAAYLNSALDDVGGFSSVLTAEDALVSAQLLKKGYSIAYVADAVVEHSHRYSLVQEFRRYFDTGLMRKEYRELFADFGADSNRGASFTRDLFKEVARRTPHKLPYAVMQTGAKYLGYKIGAWSSETPVWWKSRLGMQSFYWTSDDYLERKAVSSLD